MADVLVIAPHPDDDVIGCGGSIIKHVRESRKVTIAYMTSGEAGSLRYSKKELARIRKREARAGARILGVPSKSTVFLGNPDGYVEYNRGSLVQMVELVRRERPEIVYVPHASDAHQDHMASHRIAVEAIGRAAAPCFQECAGEPWSVNNVLGYEVWTPISRVGYVENITDTLDKKLEALWQHQSQLKNYPYDEAVRGLNRYRGAMTGKGDYVECFEIIRVGEINFGCP